MRVAMVGMGTRGDAQPMVLLAAELKQRGYDVELALNTDLRWLGERLGVPTSDLELNAREFMESEQGRSWLASGDMASYVRWLLDYKRRIADLLHAKLIEHAERADVVISGSVTELEAAVIAEAAQAQYVAVHYAPMRSNSAYPHMVVSREVFSPERNLETYEQVEKGNWPVFAPFVNELRAKVGLAPTTLGTAARLEQTGSLELQIYSRHLVPELTEWGPRRPITGFLCPSDEQQAELNGTVDPALDRWLDGGDPPVYFGFGSMPVLDPRAALVLIDQVSSKLGVRALVGAGWTDLDLSTTAGGRVRVVGEFDHEAVLPRCRAAVHHGGAGTTGSSIRAGLPTVICAVFADQPFWGARLEALGVGTTLAFTDLSADTLLAALEPLLADEPADRAHHLAAKLRSESGVTAAADAFERTVNA
ncbi:UDP:flavonoid glycosyltransferase YjiC (YdhE family) [Kribbella voronezhensis]|uniref:UDP:flavonoid glycosyltransferase YjiC (YdhE family) n=1 Tax=Kribbella voronezhensis TaxID=2512212 RepID=A0A4V3FKB1_9ACTN|nr:glycosyltransferase [Kribbella voronezhensis]TDU89533.1 UDP:flavonoid glycosyltransferase YjiC (YdhE family) [Kribbella voronezhensis]